MHKGSHPSLLEDHCHFLGSSSTAYRCSSSQPTPTAILRHLLRLITDRTSSLLGLLLHAEAAIDHRTQEEASPLSPLQPFKAAYPVLPSLLTNAGAALPPLFFLAMAANRGPPLFSPINKRRRRSSSNIRRKRRRRSRRRKGRSKEQQKKKKKKKKKGRSSLSLNKEKKKSFINLFVEGCLAKKSFFSSFVGLRR